MIKRNETKILVNAYTKTTKTLTYTNSYKQFLHQHGIPETSNIFNYHRSFNLAIQIMKGADLTLTSISPILFTALIIGRPTIDGKM